MQKAENAKAKEAEAEAKKAEAEAEKNENENVENEAEAEEAEAENEAKNSIVLKITEKDKKLLNTELQKEKTPTVIFTVTENNKTITFRKSAITFLKDNGVNITKSYYSYNATPSVYTQLEKLVKENAKLFTIINK